MPVGKNMVTFYCVSGRHKFTISDPDVVTLKAGRSKVRMKAYTGFCPKHRTRSYQFIGKA